MLTLRIFFSALQCSLRLAVSARQQIVRSCRANCNVVLVSVLSMTVSGCTAEKEPRIEIRWWHAMGGATGEKIEEITASFNRAQSEYVVVPVHKGNYTETMTLGIAAFRAGRPPHIVQVFEVGTAIMMESRDAVKPVVELIRSLGEDLNKDTFLPPVAAYYTSSDSELLSMPFNSSTPVLYYNKDAFRKAGLDPNRPPKTWPELTEYAKKTQAAGYPSGFTTSWQSWIHLENFSAWHNVPFATKANGFSGFDSELQFNGPHQVRHITEMQKWQENKIFDYGGRRNIANSKFTSGECAMLTESSAGYAAIRQAVRFDFGVGPLPFWPDRQDVPQNTIIGGASLWVLSGHTNNEYKGVGKFLSYLASPDVQSDWHQSTGYLPITVAAYELTKRQKFYDKHPDMETAILQLVGKAPTKNSRGVRIGNFVQIRAIINEELEAVWSGKKTPQDALDDAVRRGNLLVRRFENIYR